MKGATGLLISITGGNDLTLYEVDEAASRIRQEVDEDANIILGATFDDASTASSASRWSRPASTSRPESVDMNPTPTEAGERLRAQAAAHQAEADQRLRPAAPAPAAEAYFAAASAAARVGPGRTRRRRADLRAARLCAEAPRLTPRRRRRRPMRRTRAKCASKRVQPRPIADQAPAPSAASRPPRIGVFIPPAARRAFAPAAHALDRGVCRACRR